VPRFELLEGRTLPSTLTVLNNTDHDDGSLRAAITAAASGDTINFDSSLAGQTITLTSGELAINKSLDIEGLGADRLTISGNDASRIFDITDAGVTVTLAGLTISHGRAPVGAGIDNIGHLSVVASTLDYNQVVAAEHGEGRGGAIYNSSGATLPVTDSPFIGNQVLGGNGSPGSLGGRGRGGAISNTGATLTITSSTFTANQALGGYGNTGDGGAISSRETSTLTVTGSTFTRNQAVGGNGGNSDDTGFTGFLGQGQGGAISISLSDTTVTDSTFTSNQALGGNGGVQGSGAPATAQIGGALGGAIQASPTPAGVGLRVTNCTFIRNQAIGGSGATGGTSTTLTGIGFGQGGAISSNADVAVTDSMFISNQAVGGSTDVGAAVPVP
jgi:hypothetical protein